MKSVIHYSPLRRSKGCGRPAPTEDPELNRIEQVTCCDSGACSGTHTEEHQRSSLKDQNGVPFERDYARDVHEKRAVSKVISQVLQRSFSCDNGLNKEPKHRKHGESSILDLLHLQLSKSLWIISKTQRVEATTRVKRVNNLTQRSTGNSVTLNRAHQDNLGGPDGQDALCMYQTWVTQIIKSTFAKDLGSSLEPYSLAELDTVTGQELREDAPKSSKHGPSTVDDLKLTVLCKGLWISRKSGGVPPVVTWEFTGQNGPRYFTRSGPYHGLPDGATFLAAADFLIETRPAPISSELEGHVFTACPAKGDESAMLEAAIVEVVVKMCKFWEFIYRWEREIQGFTWKTQIGKNHGQRKPRTNSLYFRNVTEIGERLQKERELHGGNVLALLNTDHKTIDRTLCVICERHYLTP
ncbi:hypothetical protein LXL04_027750 [Taraxacum kok-saghyz]